ncbi:hypothetical protein NRB20_29900 [Nocardia sp. RB20]|uniref:Uncharacterized protein n=1 Tax=Nocardia macrotermitis TaxID=2585198 RepID=A0A7K0D2F5_9NOCA|nr:hypothetical protein [Nocardia macrotermitis]
MTSGAVMGQPMVGRAGVRCGDPRGRGAGARAGASRMRCGDPGGWGVGVRGGASPGCGVVMRVAGGVGVRGGASRTRCGDPGGWGCGCSWWGEPGVAVWRFAWPGVGVRGGASPGRGVVIRVAGGAGVRGGASPGRGVVMRVVGGAGARGGASLRVRRTVAWGVVGPVVVRDRPLVGAQGFRVWVCSVGGGRREWWRWWRSMVGRGMGCGA